MIKRESEMQRIVNEKMKGGTGEAVIKHVVLQEELNGKSRLIGTITLTPGSSIGEHIHEGEEEVFYILKGVATYFDNGETVTLYPGDSCLCLGGQRHSIANEGTEDLEFMAVILLY